MTIAQVLGRAFRRIYVRPPEPILPEHRRLLLLVGAGTFFSNYDLSIYGFAMPHSNLTEATAMADRLRARVFEATPASVSIGCAVRVAGEPFESVLKRADDLLLSAKRTGKNAVRSTTLKRSA
jgi:GGDEF domain-containing protein